MIPFLISIAAYIAGSLLGLLPQGPDLPQLSLNLIRDGIVFVLALDDLAATRYMFYVLGIIMTFEMGLAGFRVVNWAYNKIRGSG